MIIKKFTAKTEAEAVEAAKKELGDHLVIMNVKNIKKKGFLGIFGKNMVEVTVALESEKENDKVAQLFGAKNEMTGPLVPDSVWEKKEAPVKTEVVKEERKAVVADEDTGKKSRRPYAF